MLFHFPGASRIVIVGREGGFSPASLGPYVWGDPSDISSMTQTSAGTGAVSASNDPVGKVTDKSGNGRNLTQSTAGARPLYKTSGGLSWLEADGSDDYLQQVFAADLAQPFSRMSGFRVLTNASKALLSGANGTTPGQLFWYTDAVAKFSVEAGSEVFVDRPPPALNSDFIIYEEYNGASGKVFIDGAAPTTTNAGASATKGLTVFASQNGGSPINARWYGTVMFNRLLTAGERTALLTWLAGKQGRSL